MKDFVVFDLDGTLSDAKHRLHLLPSPETKNRTHAWDAFNLASGEDTPLQDNIDLCNQLWDGCKKLIILTGRSEVAREVTVKWLRTYGVRYDQLIMRPRNDHRKDVDFKEEMLRRIGLDRIACCFDDLEHVVKHIRGLGVTCHQVTHYDAPLLHQQDHRDD